MKASLLASTVLLLTTLCVAQERTFVDFSAISEPASDPNTPDKHNPVRGMLQCVGGGNPAPADRANPPWCPPGTRTVAKARITFGKWVTSDANVSGIIRWYLNFDVDSTTYTGNWWGSFILEIPGKGTWEGWVFGEEVGVQMSYRLIGVGYGEFDKCTIMAAANFEDYTSKPAVITGRYLAPLAK